MARVIFFAFSLFTDRVTFQAGEFATLGLGNFVVNIGGPCSGVESTLLLLGLFLLLLTYEGKELNFKRSFAVFCLGLVGVYILNIIRVASLIVIGTKYPDFALGAFHSQAGWIMFSIFILGLLYFFYPWMKKK